MSTDRMWFKYFEERDMPNPHGSFGVSVRMVVPINPAREDPGFREFREFLKENFNVDSFHFVYFVNQDCGLFPNVGIATPEDFKKLATPEECLRIFRTLISKIKDKEILDEIKSLIKLWDQGYYVMELE